VINGDWLSEIIEAYYNGGRKTEQLDFLKNYLVYYEENILPFRTYKNQPITKRTADKQKTVIQKLQGFLSTLNVNVRVSEYGVIMGNQFVTYMRENVTSNDNTVGKYLKYSKTIVQEAKTLGIETHPTLDSIKGFTTETPTVIFTDDELETVLKLNFLNERWEIARDWLIVGIYTGQRGTDLFSMTKAMIITDQKGRSFVDFTQQKVPVYAKIPVHNEVKRILKKYNGDFPPLYTENLESNKTMFNEHLKEICERAGIDRLDFGLQYDRDTKRNIPGKYPVHKLVSSHLCRRQFASMHYGKIPTPIIMSVTGHKTESEFLKYIGKGANELSERMFEYWDKMEDDKVQSLANSMPA
jgi:integrase